MKTVISYDPDSNTFDFLAERPYRHADMRHAQLWLKGDGYTPAETRRLLQHAMVLGYFLDRPLIIR